MLILPVGVKHAAGCAERAQNSVFPVWVYKEWTLRTM